MNIGDVELKVVDGFYVQVRFRSSKIKLHCSNLCHIPTTKGECKMTRNMIEI